jgi:hypothetical protein
MKLLYKKDGFVCYEYGLSKDNLIGKVTIEITNKENCKLEYYGEDKSFKTSTGHTVGMIYKFIKNNNFPDTYTYAC